MTARYDPVKTAARSIASIPALCAALDISEADLQAALAIPLDERYKEALTPKRDGSFRSVFNPHHLIRKIQRRINRRIFANPNVIGWPDHLFGSIPNQKSDEGDFLTKDYITCAEQHLGAKSILTLDIKNFFDNIDCDLVYAIFWDFLKFPANVSEVLTNICCRGPNLVQGALTSSYLATLCLYDVEGAVVKRLKHKGLIYTRLVDDINVSSKVADYDFDYAEKLIEAMLLKHGLPLNYEKTRIQNISSVPVTVHGLRVSFNSARLPSDEVRRIRAAVQNVEKLAREAGYRTSRSYRKDFNRCLGRVNKLKRVGHMQHSPLLKRLQEIFPLPSKNDITLAIDMVDRLEKESLRGRQDSYWYHKRYYVAHERLIILRRSFPAVAAELRSRLTAMTPKYD